jgi:hypothetical protein
LKQLIIFITRLHNKPSRLRCVRNICCGALLKKKSVRFLPQQLEPGKRIFRNRAVHVGFEVDKVAFAQSFFCVKITRYFLLDTQDMCNPIIMIIFLTVLRPWPEVTYTFLPYYVLDRKSRTLSCCTTSLTGSHVHFRAVLRPWPEVTYTLLLYYVLDRKSRTISCCTTSLTGSHVHFHYISAFQKIIINRCSMFLFIHLSSTL